MCVPLRSKTMFGIIQKENMKSIMFTTKSIKTTAATAALVMLSVPYDNYVNAQNISQNSVSVVKDAQRIRYSPMIFGHFIEHFDTQVYGGIFDPGNPRSDDEGFRTDVLQALRDIKVPIVRWPGGCFVSTYHWVDGIGKERKPVYDKAWQVEDPNTFGTDEYIMWCRKVGCEPYICTNAGTGTPEEMSDWVEYCNLSIGKWGRMRMENGHEEPYGVKYWSVGNENYGAWELGAKTVDEWGPLVRESSKLMLSVDKSLKLFAAANPDPEWTRPLLQTAGDRLDYISIHGYWDPLFHVNNPASYADCMLKTEFPESDIVNTINILNETGFGDGRIKIAFDEWNLKNWHHPWHGDLRRGFDIEARRKNDINSQYTMADALFSACFLNSCLRHSDIVEIACFSPIVNTRGAIFVHKNGILKRTTYHVFWMYTNLMKEYMVPIDIVSDKLIGPDVQVNAIDGILTADEQGREFTLALVNKEEKNDHSIVIDFASLGKSTPKTISAMVLSGSSADDYNDVGANENRVVPQQRQLKVKEGKVTLPAHSLVMLDIR